MNLNSVFTFLSKSQLQKFKSCIIEQNI